MSVHCGGVVRCVTVARIRVHCNVRCVALTRISVHCGCEVVPALECAHVSTDESVQRCSPVCGGGMKWCQLRSSGGTNEC